MDATVIGSIHALSHLSEEQQGAVANACRELDVEAGTRLMEEGDFGYAMFAVLEGEADVSISGKYVRTLGPGDVFGEIAVFFGGRRTATVVATTQMRLAMLFNAELRRLDQEVPEVADALRSTVADRLATEPS
jgi:CRP-like cAMP-binding protein